MEKPSPRQKALLKYIWDYIDENQYPPTYEEMLTALDFSSKSHVNYHLKALAYKGYIEQAPGRSRGLRLTEKTQKLFGRQSDEVQLPVYGYIGASMPTWTATQTDMDPEEVITVTPDIVPKRSNLYGLRVRGDSMIDALINDGDIVVMCPHPEGQPRNGAMVAVRLLDSDETTLKKFYRHNDSTIKLVPANPNYDVIEVPAKEIEVQGRVVAVIRQYA